MNLQDDFWKHKWEDAGIFGKGIWCMWGLEEQKGALNVIRTRGESGITESGLIVAQERPYHPIIAIEEVNKVLNVHLFSYMV